MDENDEILVVNYKKVMKTNTLLNSTRLVAIDILENDYTSLTKYFTSLSENDLQYLLGLLDNQDKEEFGELVILSEMLSNGEGLESSENTEEVKRRVEVLISFLTLESLYRKGFIRLFRENMSFGEEFRDKKIAEKL